MSDAAFSAVKAFPSRVIKGRNYEAQNDPVNRLGTSARFKQKVISSSDTEPEQANRARDAKSTASRQKKAPNTKAAKPITAETAEVVVDPAPSAYDIPDLGDLLTTGNVQFTLATEQNPTALSNDAGPHNDNAGSVPVQPDLPPTIISRRQSSSSSHVLSNAQIDALSHKIDYLQKSLGEKMSNLHGAITYLSGRVDDVVTKQGELKDLMNKCMADNIVDDFVKKPNFPFTTVEDFLGYLEVDPEGKHLTERYAIIRKRALSFRKTVGPPYFHHALLKSYPFTIL